MTSFPSLPMRLVRKRMYSYWGFTALTAFGVLLIFISAAALLPIQDWYNGIPPPRSPHFPWSLGKLWGIDKLHHCCATLTMGGLLQLGLLVGFQKSRKTALMFSWLFLGVFWSAGIEFSQGFLGYRNFELYDMFANFVGLLASSCMILPFFSAKR
jgi:hypothetical protein